MNSTEWQRGYDAGYAAGRLATSGGALPLLMTSPFGVSTLEPEHGHPFTLEVDGVIVGRYELISMAVDAMRDIDGHKAVVYDGNKVADYRGGKARFKFGRTQWSRA